MSFFTDSSEPASEAELAETESPRYIRLQRELDREKHRNTKLTAQLKRQTQLQGQLQLQAEQEEEYITNKLMKRLQALKHEKDELARQVEVEEEMITNALTKKLQKVKEEKVNLENQLEWEQEYIVNKLQKQLSAVLEEKRVLESRLMENTGAILQSIQHHLDQWRTRSNSSESAGAYPGNALLAVAREKPPPTLSSSFTSAASASTSAWGGSPDDTEHAHRTHLLVKHLTQEIDALGELQEKYRRECEEQQHCNEHLKVELSRLQVENAGLGHRIAREREIREEAMGEKARLETELELGSERMFNSGTASRVSSVPSSPSLTSIDFPRAGLSERLDRLASSPRSLTPSALNKADGGLSPRKCSPSPTPSSPGMFAVSPGLPAFVRSSKDTFDSLPF